MTVGPLSRASDLDHSASTFTVAETIPGWQQQTSDAKQLKERQKNAADWTNLHLKQLKDRLGKGLTVDGAVAGAKINIFYELALAAVSSSSNRNAGIDQKAKDIRQRIANLGPLPPYLKDELLREIDVARARAKELSNIELSDSIRTYENILFADPEFQKMISNKQRGRR